MAELTAWLRRAGVARGDAVGLVVFSRGVRGVQTNPPDPPPVTLPAVVSPGRETLRASAASRSAKLASLVAVAVPSGETWTGADPGEAGIADAELRPRWVVWSNATASQTIASA